MFEDQNNNKQVFNLSPADFKEKTVNDEKAVIIDVRTDQEYKMGHIPNSNLIDIMNPAFLQEIEKLDKTKNYYLYCRSGNRSYHAGMAMLQMGFENVSHLQNGILDWYEPLEQGI